MTPVRTADRTCAQPPSHARSWVTRARSWATHAVTLAALALGSWACSDDAPADTSRTDAPQTNATPDATAPPTVWLADEAHERSLRFTWLSGQQPDRYWMPEIMGGGAALFDRDGDGWLDAYLVQGGGDLAAPPTEREPNRLFANLGEGTFEDVTAGSGADDRGYGMGVACGDVDNDGDVDVFVTNVGPDVLLANDGSGTFTDVTATHGGGHAGWGTSATFVDTDADGWLDLFVTTYLAWDAEAELVCANERGARDYCNPANYEAAVPDVLWHNRGNGTLQDVSAEAGFAQTPGSGLGVAAADFDGDGRVDLFVANDGMPDRLWHQLPDGSFEDVALLAGCANDHSGKSKAGMGVAVADVDDDGDRDLLVCNLDRQSDSFFHNQGDGTFRDATLRARLATASRPYTRFGVGLVDFDCNGHLDIFQANGRVQAGRRPVNGDMFAEHNLLLAGEDGQFVPVDTVDGTAVPLAATARAAAFGDVDGDGALDVLVVNRDAPAVLLMNVHPARGNSVVLTVRDEHGRDAVGATVSGFVESEGARRRVTRDVRAGFSYLASSSPRVHIGLGTATALRDVHVLWTDGSRQSFGDLPAGNHVLLREP